MRDKLKSLIDTFFCSVDIDKFYAENQKEKLADWLREYGVTVPPCEIGEEIWFVDRNESGEPIDITGAVFLAQSKGCIIATSYINDYDLTETIEYHINRTQDNYDTNLLVYPIEDCYVTKEEAEQALKARSRKNE